MKSDLNHSALYCRWCYQRSYKKNFSKWSYKSHKCESGAPICIPRNGKAFFEWRGCCDAGLILDHWHLTHWLFSLKEFPNGNALGVRSLLCFWPKFISPPSSQIGNKHLRGKYKESLLGMIGKRTRKDRGDHPLRKPIHVNSGKIL